MLEKTDGAIMNGYSRDTDNVGYKPENKDKQTQQAAEFPKNTLF
jgi:hypothetical protein